jgi:alkanesulfonate monooxygenase SsuD/methylene tetrahydromethanopterin reductase-like flavin-dependent oxidoreductase (luciferase family)
MTSFGVVFPAHAPAEALPSFATRAETLGYDELWVVEDCFLSGGLTQASAALAATKELRVGVGLLPAAVRNAAIVAMEIATVARLYPARFSVAFGHGVESWMTQIDARPAKRLAALGEVITAVRMLLCGETVNAAGAFVNLASVTLENPPAVAPQILAGTTGPEGIAMAGRRADGLLLPEGCGPRFVAHAKQLAERATPLPGLPFAIVVYAWMRIGDDESARAALTDAVSHWIDSGLYAGPMREAGVNGAPELGPLTRKIADELAIAGTAPQCAAAVNRLVTAGAQRVVLAAVGPDFADQYEQFAHDVLPDLRSSDTAAS